MAKINLSHTSSYFERQFEKLPRHLQKIAGRKILLFEENLSNQIIKFIIFILIWVILLEIPPFNQLGQLFEKIDKKIFKK